MNSEGTKNFQCSKTIVYDVIMVNTCHYTIVKTHRMYNGMRKL